jgi:hypothetical protein
MMRQAWASTGINGVAGIGRRRRSAHGRGLTDLAVIRADGGEGIGDLAVLRQQRPCSGVAPRLRPLAHAGQPNPLATT